MVFPYPEAICLNDSWWFSCTAGFTFCKKQVKLLMLTNLCLVSVPHGQWCCCWIRQSWQRMTSCSAHGLHTLCQWVDHRWTAVCHSPGPSAIKEDEKGIWNQGIEKKLWHLWAIRYLTFVCQLNISDHLCHLSSLVFSKPRFVKWHFSIVF